MKKIVSIVFIAGAAGAAIVFYLTRRTPEERIEDDIEHAANDAYKTMNKQINKVENSTENLLDVK